MPARCLTGCVSWLILVLAVVEIDAADWHVTPKGSPQGKGSVEEPWDLAKALVATEVVKPGDTVWIHAGMYRGGFVSRA